MKSGIYTITCLANGKYYIGYATNLEKRKNHHFSRLKINKHCNPYLQKAYNKYGKNNFKFEILEEYPDKGFILPSMENYWCNLLDAHNAKYGYNILPTNPYNKYKQTKEMILKASLKRKGFKHSEETKNKMSKTRTGKKINRKSTVWNKGKKMTKEFCEKISKIRTEKFLNDWILILDKEYNILKKVRTKKEVLEFFKVSKNSYILNCLNKSNSSIYGHYLMYEKDFLNGKKIKKSKFGNSCCIIKNDTKIKEKEFESLTECAKYLNIKIQTLIYRIKNKTVKNNNLIILKKDYDS